MFACKSLCDLAKRAQDIGLRELQLEFTSRAVELKNDDGWSWQQHGKALLDNGRLPNALAAYEQAIIFSKSAAAYNGRAETLRSLNRPHEALEAYEAVIAAHPEDVVAKNGCACVLIDMRRFGDAMKTLPDEDAGITMNWIGFHIRGMCILKQGHVSDASEGLQVGVKRCPGPKSRDYVASALAIANLRQGENEIASRVLGEMDKQHADESNRHELVCPSGPILVRMHVWGVCGLEKEATQAYERLPATLPQHEQDTKKELAHRHIHHLPPTTSDDWGIDRLSECLLAA